VLKKIAIGLALSVGLSCSHIRPHSIPATDCQAKIDINLDIRDAQTIKNERTGNAFREGRIYLSPEKAESVGSSDKGSTAEK
jgi:hypothetical protein